MLNGKDPISLQVISAFDRNVKLADISEQYDLTLDQVKRIKRFYNYSQKIHTMLGSELGSIYEALGTKGLVLSKYIKENDTNAIQELLSVSPAHVTRDKLIQLSGQYDEKMKRMHQYENAYIQHLADRDILEQKIEAAMFELSEIKVAAKLSDTPIKEYSDEEITQLETFINTTQKELNKLNDETKTIYSDLKAIKTSHIQSFEESSIEVDVLSEREIKRHRHLQSLAMKWLFRQGYIVASEVELPNKHIADIAAVKDGHVVIVEVKVSNKDFKRDDKWPEYLPYCNEIYFLFDFYIEEPPPTGILRVNEHDAIVEWSKSKLSHQCRAVEQVSTSINRILSRKFIFGY